MKTLIALAAIAGTAILSIQPAAADYFERRQAKQSHRIEHGIRNGSLTYHEAARLRAEQSRIARYESHAKRDGYVSPAERARLAAAQDRASRHIYFEKHDGQTRGAWRRRWSRWW